ncbi:MAG: DUF3298 and DUF4163 domain-containing protein [Tannerellaceae bacterium]|jgi:hypothetical protein|nr:DUF3298 and DUF4163 domain-containing protein [Tannerellaceae bacterium]
MKNNLYRPLAAILLTCIWITGCKTKPKTASENNIQWDSVHVEKTYHMQDDPENPNCNLQISFVFPVRFDDSKEILAAVQRHFIRSCMGEPYENYTPSEAVGKYVEQYLNEYKKLETDFVAEKEHDHEAPAASWFSFFEFFSNEITYNKNDLLCYTVNYENYTGGAHGSHSHTSYVIDLSTGLPLTEKDFFVDGFQDELAGIIVRKIAEKNQARNAEELENMGFFSVDEIYPNGNFSVDDAGITYYFNEYEIAAYVIGSTKVFLPYGEIKHLLRDNNRIALPTGY